MKFIKRYLAVIDPGFLIVISICLLAIWPFLSHASLPQETDAELHIYRLAELSRVIRSGVLFPRWAPNFYYGYGYPIFNYYAPLAYYLSLPFELMPGVSPVDAIKLLFTLAPVGAGIGMYGYVRELWGRKSGLVAAAVYVYSPYVVFVDPHSRGDVAEILSFAFFSLALWSLDRLRRMPSSWSWLSSVFLVAGLILSHNLMAMVFGGILMIWAIWQATFGSDISPKISSDDTTKFWWRLRIPGAIVLGIGVASFFWLTVALEQNAVNLSSLIGTGSHFDFRNHFLGLAELFSLPHLIDWGATEPRFSLILGPMQWLLGGVGVLSLFARHIRHRKQAVIFVILLVVFLFLMLSQSLWVWETLPLLPFLQFPWRLLGPVAALLAILGGVGASWLMSVNKLGDNAWVPAGMVGLVLIFALPAVQVPPWPKDFGPTDKARVMVKELSGRWLGTTSTADFVPATVDIIPNPEPKLIQAYLEGLPIDRVNSVTLPAGTEVRSEELSLLHTRYHVTGEEDFLLRLFLFDFPGWRVKVDGRSINTELGRPEGFIVIPVPAGNHIVDLRFGNTPVRTLAYVISGFSIGVTLLIAWWVDRKGTAESNDAGGSIDARIKLWPVTVIAISILIVQAIIIEPVGWLRYESSGYEVAPAEHQTFVDFGGQVALIGYDGPDTTVQVGDRITLDAYWKAQQALNINYQVFVHMLDAENIPVAQSDKLNPGDFPTKRWPLDKYVRDEHLVSVPETIQPGEYKLAIGLWSASGEWRLPIIDAEGLQMGDAYILPQKIVVLGE